VKKETVINRSYHHRYMSENAKELEPDLKQLLDVVVEGGENGVRLDEIFDKLQKDDRDTKVLIGVMDDLSQLREFGYIHRKKKEGLKVKFGGLLQEKVNQLRMQNMGDFL